MTQHRTFRLGWAITIIGALSCGDSGPSGISHTTLITELQFAARTGEEIDGVEISPGLDLDGRVSDRLDTAGCNRADFVSPDGTAGVDNQFTFLFEAIEDAFAGAVTGIVQVTINEGRLLLMFELSEVDDMRNDDHVVVRAFLGEGRPDLSAANRIVRDQTFELKDAPISTTTGRIVDGVLDTDPFDVEFPIAVFDVFTVINLSNARVHAEIHEDGTMTGLFGGGLSTEQIMGIANMADMLQEIQISPVLNVLLPRWVDLLPDENGVCTEVSTTLEFHATTAFLYDDLPAP